MMSHRGRGVGLWGRVLVVLAFLAALLGLYTSLTLFSRSLLRVAGIG
jgi:hypothetical protein